MPFRRPPWSFARFLLALAAGILFTAPLIDAAGSAATKQLESGNTSAVIRILSAFDVVDDVLDHMPGDASATQQHVIPTAAWPPRVAEAVPPAKQPRALLTPSHQHFPGSADVEREKRPPRE